MRRALVDTLSGLIERGEPVQVITTDTGFHVFDDFQTRYPENYMNIGIAESAMVGLAAGLALNGRQVFLYGIVPFVTMRCFEQIRVDLCYNRLPVKIVGVGGGFTYGPAGATHHSIEDIAVMRCLPGMTVVCPADAAETKAAVESSLALPGPCYLRIGKTGEPAVHDAAPTAFAIGKGIRLRNGRDIAVVATGNMVRSALDVCDRLVAAGKQPELISMHTVKPIDVNLLEETAGRCRTIATIEEHSIVGGLGAAVAGVVADKRLAVELHRFAAPDTYSADAADQEALRCRYGLTPDRMAREILSIPESIGGSVAGGG